MTADRHPHLRRIVGPFADVLLAGDLPQLPAARRAEVVDFVERRAASIPSVTRFGVMCIGVLYRAAIAIPGGQSVARFAAAKPIPVLAEYPRLIRSLGFAYVWEQWPDTRPTGAPS